MKKNLLFLCLSVLSFGMSNAQTPTTPQFKNKRTLVSAEAVFTPQPFNKRMLRLPIVGKSGQQGMLDVTEFKLKEVNPKTDAYGYQHYHYNQTINGIEVDGAEMRVHVKNGTIEDQNGSWLLDVPARLTALRASQPTQAILGTVESSLKGQKINSHDLTVSSANGRTATNVPDGAKLVYVPIGKDLENISPDSVRLAYRFTVRTGAFGKYMYYIDATNGELLYKIDMVCRFMGNRQHQHTDACSPEAMPIAQPQAAPLITETNDPGSRLFTQYSGSRTANTTKQSDGKWSLKDLNRQIEVLQIKGWETDDNGDVISVKSAPYLNSSNQWRSSSQTDINGYATDALWAAQQTYDFYRQTFGEWKYNTSNPNQKVNVYANADFDKFAQGIPNDNAFYDGDNIYLGVGYLAKGILPQSALDIVAHELSHGITGGTSGLRYINESGAINESLSDIFGTAVERYKRPERFNWTLGEDTGMISRSLSNPNAYEQPGEYGGKFFYSSFGEENVLDNGGVHRFSGIMNRWFYLLCEGGTGTTESGFAYNVTPIGMADALKIVYLAQTNYITPTMNFYNVSLATYRAARAIFGTDAKQTKQVQNAWAAVNVIKSRIFKSCGNDVHEPNNTFTTGTRIGVDTDVEGNFADFVSSTYNQGDLSKTIPQSEAAKYRDWYQFTTTSEKPNFKIAMENYVQDNIVIIVYKDKIDSDHVVTAIEGPMGGPRMVGKRAGLPDPKTLNVSTESDPYNNVKAHTYYLVVAASLLVGDLVNGQELAYRVISQPSQGCYRFKVVTSAKPYITDAQASARDDNQLLDKNLVWLRNSLSWTESEPDTESKLILGLADEKQTGAKAPLVCRAFSRYSDQIWQITNSKAIAGGTQYSYNLKNLNTDKVMEIDSKGNVFQNDYDAQKTDQRFTIPLDGFSVYGPLYWSVADNQNRLLSVVNVKATAPNATQMQKARPYTDEEGNTYSEAPQVWVVDPVTTLPAEGEYLIRSVNDKGQFLSFPAKKSLQTTAITEGSEQRWTIKPTKDGRYTLVNRLSGQSLALATSSASEGITYTRVATNPSQATQNWKILPTGPDKSFKIVNSVSNKPITVQTNRSVIQNNYTGSVYQRWYIERVKPIKEGYYYLQNRATGLYMDVSGSSKDNGTTLISYPYRGTYNQLFYVQPQTDGTYIIENVTSEKNLSINSQNALAQPYQWEADANKVNHRWQITYTTDGYFKVISKFSGQALQAGISAGESGIKSPIVQNNYRFNDPYKQWNFRVLGSVVDKTVQTLAPTTESVSAENTAVLTIFPNPAQNQVTVAYALSEGEQAQVKVVNVLGMELSNQPVLSTQTIIDISRIPDGLYLINLESNLGKRFVQKLVIKK